MSINISNSFQALFSADVKHAYQSMGSGLLHAVRRKTDVNGKTYKFHKMGKGLATPRIPQSDITPMNVSHTGVIATLEDWNAAEYSDIFDLGKISFNERQELASTVAGGIARRMEQLVIDALDAGANNLQVDENLGGTASGLTVVKLRRAKRLLDDAGVPSSDRFFLHGAIGLEQLLGTTEVTSADFNTVRALVNGEVDNFMGFKFISIESRDEGGLPVNSDIRKNFAFHKQAIGVAIGTMGEKMTKIDWVPEKTSWLINGMFSAGSVGIEEDGIYEVLTNDLAVS